MEDLRSYAPFGVAALLGLVGFAAGDYQLLTWLTAVAVAAGGVVWHETRWGIVATATLGLGSAAYLFSRKLDASGFSLCDVNEFQNCDLVNNSAASEVFGLPVSLLGSGYFLGLIVAAFLASEGDQRRRLFQVTTITAAAGCVFSVYLFTQILALGTSCPFCYSIYMACGILLWAGLRGLGEVDSTAFDEIAQLPSSTTFVTLAGIFLAVLLFGYSTYSSRDSSAAVRPVDPTNESDVERLATLYAPPAGPVSLEGDEPILGDPDAPYIVVEFADFGCPHCATASQQLKELVQLHPEIQVRFRPFALSGACNPALPPSDQGLDRCRAAMAAECATQQGRFWDYATLVFQNQRDLSDPTLEAAAERAGLDMDAWRTCMSDQATVAEIVADAEAGFRAGVRGTPTLYLQGVAPGEQWVDVCMGPEAVLVLTDLHATGQTLPDPKFGSCEEAHAH